MEDLDPLSPIPADDDPGRLHGLLRQQKQCKAVYIQDGRNFQCVLPELHLGKHKTNMSGSTLEWTEIGPKEMDPPEQYAHIPQREEIMQREGHKDDAGKETAT
jgi:hypothetical protein